MKFQVFCLCSVALAALVVSTSGSPHPSGLMQSAKAIKKLIRGLKSPESSNSGSSSTESVTSRGRSIDSSNPLSAFVDGVQAARQTSSSSSDSNTSTTASEDSNSVRTRRTAVDFDIVSMIIQVVVLMIEIQIRIALKLFGIRLPESLNLSNLLREPLRLLENLS
ncbi:uncharacterized protein LOC108668896 [Hyalella azteca]|uniref:Uncharacterized protein LOC108668896 n=1 Tax=Hyalella azteca TaxID=294128 RepID=A0A8B7NDG7_HYAAZ|nr:uncharacterized protein LOC108668896 [Hyalella azteca]